MIIKSTSRKSKTFSQLLSYLLREKGFDRDCYNFYSSKDDIKNIINEFLHNASYLDNSRGSVYMYHDILSLEKNRLSTKEQKAILKDLVNQYISSRAKENLAFTVTHTDKDNIHTHIVISANKIKDNKRYRLSKKEFNSIKKELEVYKNKKYPELKKTQFYDKPKNYSKSKRAEQEMKFKRNKQSNKDYIKEKLRDFFKVAQNETILKSAMNEFGFKLYSRGKTNGIKFQNKSYRLKTLGVEKAYDRFVQEQSKSKSNFDTKINTKSNSQQNTNHKTNSKFEFKK